MSELIKYADYFLEVNKPKDFAPYNSDNVLIAQEQEFESMVASLEENGVNNAGNLTVFEFYSRIKFYEKRSKK